MQHVAIVLQHRAAAGGAAHDCVDLITLRELVQRRSGRCRYLPRAVGLAEMMSNSAAAARARHVEDLTTQAREDAHGGVVDLRSQRVPVSYTHLTLPTS